ncbi:MAG: transglutaminase-like cysteine peptidase [Sphingobacteriales bacterium]|jgi:predicted transglutaminase-like cysteine proteinase
MAGRLNQALRTGAILAFVAAAILAASVEATVAGERTGSLGVSLPPPERPLYVAVGEPTRPPIGWVDFCIEYRPECATRPSPPRDVVLSPKAWADMVKVNAWVNDAIKPITDIEHWGTIERWSYPDDGYGDCEDYVLLKRRMLIQAGWPREALLITVVRDKKGDGHAVLTVKTDRGEFILDNQEPQVLAWDRTGYRFVKRQSQADPNTWVLLGEPRVAPAIVSAR